MLYLLENNEHYKVGYTQDSETLTNRLSTYKTHNPIFKFLGIREGNKEDEKKYHKLMNCDSKSEWSCNIGISTLDNIKLDFSKEGYIASLFGETIELFKGDIPEIYSIVTIPFINMGEVDIFVVILCFDGVYIRKNIGNTYKVVNQSLQIKTFYQDYDPEYGEKYIGFVINGVLFYDFQIRRTPRNPFGNYALKDSIIYNKLLPIIKDFKLNSNEEDEE